MQNTALRLQATFRQALIACMGAPAVLTGCSDEGIENDPGFVPVICEEGRPQYLDGLEPAEAVDYLALGLVGAEGDPFHVLEETGTPCLDAGDEAACLSELALPAVETGLMLGESIQLVLAYELRATRGAEVISVSTTQGLKDLLVPIDTTSDAILLATNGYSATCSRSGAKPVADGFEVQLFRHPGCDGRRRYLFHVDADGRVSMIGSSLEREPEPGCVVGRRPAGLKLRALERRHSLGAYFAQTAELEAASVHAFLALGAALSVHAAPPSLAARARAAAAEEVRHARAVSRLARTFGGRPRAPRVSPQGVPMLEALARDNAVEGCVRETYGALVAHHQGSFARDARIRRLYRSIAVDETRHAALSWDIADWARARLGRAANRRILACREEAALALNSSAKATLPAAFTERAGLPGPEAAAVLLKQLDVTLWGRA